MIHYYLQYKDFPNFEAGSLFYGKTTEKVGDKMKKKIDEISYLRGMAGLAVVMVHISAIPVSSLRGDSFLMLLFSLINRGLKFTSPVFIFISGLIFFYSYQNKPFQFTSFLKKRLSAVLIPYLGWSLFYYFYFVYKGIYLFDIKFLLEGLFLGKISYHFYFMIIIIQFYFLFGVFHFLFKKFNPHILLCVFAVVNLLSLRYLKIQYADRIFLNYIFFFSLGCYWGGRLEQIKDFLDKNQGKVYLSYGMAALLYTAQFYFYHGLQRSINVFHVDIMWFIFSTVSIFFCFQISRVIANRATDRVKAVGQFLSRCSFITYLSHPFLLYLSERFLDGRGMLSVSRRFMINTLVVYGSVLLMEFIYINFILRIIKGGVNKKKSLQPEA